ncbi:MAG: ABC transporter ATP-binding protein [Alphaproteobacteria bacterium]|nr:ABC transporter ATP-binding protein [Alphaproteobacteria bacterium]
MSSIISISGLTKTYADGLVALSGIDLEIRRGEIFALLGPNGAGKTTLINIVCGIVNPSSGTVVAGGYNVITQSRQARFNIGLVPQELATDWYESVWGSVSFSRGLFGRPANPALVEDVLKRFHLWEKRDAKIMTLSGGMKRRVMIAKALAHEPTILFLDEPTASVDVELRRELWAEVRGLRESGVTIILTTHYIEEAEEMADRIGVINKGTMVVVDDKIALMKKLGGKHLTLHLQQSLAAIPSALADWPLSLGAGGHQLIYSFDSDGADTGIDRLLHRLTELKIAYRDLHTSQRSLEDIFVDLISERKGRGP